MKDFIKIAADENSFWSLAKEFAGKTWKPITVTGLGIALPAIGRHFLNKAIEDVAADPKFSVKDTDAIIGRAKKLSGITKIPHKSFENLDNAVYVPGGTIPEKAVGKLKQIVRTKMQSKDKKQKESAKVLNTMIEYSLNPKGGIILGKKFKNPYIVAHELGHAQMANEGGIYGFMQKYGPVAQVIGGLSSFGSIIPFAMGKPDIGKAMLYGGLGASGLGVGAELLYEREASELGRKLLKNVKLPKKSRDLGEKALDLAWGTYWTKALGKTLPVAAGAAFI